MPTDKGIPTLIDQWRLAVCRLILIPVIVKISIFFIKAHDEKNTLYRELYFVVH